ncbi:unnamed protein product, partial [Phaeothamnion confervicola]
TVCCLSRKGLEEDDVVQELLAAGVLCVFNRPLNYQERREDGYLEPLQLFLLGTSHVADQSALDVRRLIAAVRPESVVVELCKSRVGLMAPKDESVDPNGNGVDGGASVTGSGGGARRLALGLSGASLPEALSRSLRLGGQAPLLLRLLLAKGSGAVAAAMVGGGAGGGNNRQQNPLMETGADFRAAREAADAVGAEIVLGDRPIELTLRRAWLGLSWTEQLQVIAGLLAVATTGAATELEASTVLQAAGGARPDDDAVDAMLALLASRFPSASVALVQERDAYLAWSLKRSRAVCGKQRVVGVVGRAHLAGVAAAIEADRGGDTLVFRDLVRVPKESGGGGGAAALVARLAGEMVATAVLWDVYQQWNVH